MQEIDEYSGKDINQTYWNKHGHHALTPPYNGRGLKNGPHSNDGARNPLMLEMKRGNSQAILCWLLDSP